MNFIRRSIYIVAFSLLSLPAMAQTTVTPPERNPAWATSVETSINLFKVNEGFYRSAKLSKKDLQTLNSLGIKTIVNLRSFHSDKTLLENSGIQAVQVGINTWSISDDNVVAALRAIRAAQKDGPVLLHCWHGADRTGLVTAMYRMLYQDWSREQALEELLHGGYGYHAMWKNIPVYLKTVDIEKIRTAVNYPAPA